MEQAIRTLDQLLLEQRYAELEAASRDLLAQQRFYLWHLYLIVALLRMDRRDDAGAELDILFSYKFNIADRAWPEIRAAFPARFEQHFILSTMKPGMGLEAGASVRRHWTVPYPLADEASFGTAASQIVAESVPALAPFDKATVRVTTFGSCFAANLARMLKASGVEATNLLIEESINSPLANQAFLAALVDPGRGEHAARLTESFGAGFMESARAQIAAAQVIVLTLGVAPSFFHRDGGRLAFLEDYRALLERGLLEMRTPTVEQVKSVVHDVLRLLRVINPAARIYVTISPVPLMGTAELSNAVVADCVSKTTLRAALHEALREGPLADVYYWPSFEIVRWLGAHTTLPVFGGDDNVSRHVSDWVVKAIVARFSSHLFGDARPAKLSRWS